MGDTSSSIFVQGVIDFPVVSSFYQHSFESPKSVEVRHAYFGQRNQKAFSLWVQECFMSPGGKVKWLTSMILLLDMTLESK